MAEIIKDGTAEYKVISMTSTMQELEDKILNKLNDKLLALFPIGTIIETTNHVSPAEYIGGTWEELPAGTVTITAGTVNENNHGYTFTAGDTKYTRDGNGMTGELWHTLTSKEMPSHWHDQTNDLDHQFGYSYDAYSDEYRYLKFPRKTDDTHLTYDTYAAHTTSAGGNQPHTNLPPIYGVYRYRRIADSAKAN